MSNSLQFSSGIKSTQRGVILLSGVLTNTATLSPAVDTSKTQLRMLGWSVTGATLDATMFTHVTLTNSTTVTATRGGSGGNVSVSWEITEYY